jgi:hypothetical protein
LFHEKYMITSVFISHIHQYANQNTLEEYGRVDICDNTPLALHYHLFCKTPSRRFNCKCLTNSTVQAWWKNRQEVWVVWKSKNDLIITYYQHAVGRWYTTNLLEACDAHSANV